MQVINTIGRRKSAVARIYVSAGKGNILVNKKDYKEYFTIPTLQDIVEQPFRLTENAGKFDVSVNVSGGGVKGQAEAVRLAISRALVENDTENRPPLKANACLRRDPRKVERKKPGQPKARKRFQFSKR